MGMWMKMTSGLKKSVVGRNLDASFQRWDCRCEPGDHENSRLLQI